MTDRQPTPSPTTRARISGLDGLRAIAVVAVLLYHAEVSWAAGGFVGVDVFFVLSGYLVASIVLDGFDRTGGLGFRRFWSSRLRRLAPAQIALIVAVTVTLALAHSDELADLRGQVLAALTGTTNWYLIATEGSYFEQLGRPPILRHLWSLAIELQFYLVVPPVLVVMLRVWAGRLDRIVAVLGVAVVASTVYLAVLFEPGADPTRAYFSSVGRMAAPLVGVLLALVWRPGALERGAVAHRGRTVAMVGAGAVVVLLWIMHVAGDRSAVMYRGGFLATALVAALVVAAVVHPTSRLGGRFGLGHPALVAIGLRSYGLYLWHWPVFVLLRPRIDVGWSWGTTFVVRMVLTIALAEACYRFVERPWHLRAPDASWRGIRRRLFQPSGIATGPRLATLSSVVLVVASVGILAVPRSGSDDISESLLAGEAALAASPSTTTPPTPAPVVTEPGETTTTVPGAATEPARVTLVGDSVMLGAVPDLQASFGDRANIDATVGRQAESLGPVVAQLAVEGRLNPTVVVQVGINGTVTREDLHAIEDAADGRRLLVVNARVPRAWEQDNNAIVRATVPSIDNAEIVDWYQTSDGRRDWYLDDGVHLTAEGRAAYAELIRAAVDG